MAPENSGDFFPTAEASPASSVEKSDNRRVGTAVAELCNQQRMEDEINATEY
jgi:hypothetical protein